MSVWVVHCCLFPISVLGSFRWFEVMGRIKHRMVGVKEKVMEGGRGMMLNREEVCKILIREEVIISPQERENVLIIGWVHWCGRWVGVVRWWV